MTSRNSFDAAKEVIRRLHDAGHVAYLAGGCVRDRLLGISPQDHDVATDAAPDEVCSLFRRTKKVGAKFGVVIVRLHGCEIEVATFRLDGAYSDGRRPDNVVFSSAGEDAQRRDFTINGMFYDPFADRLVDLVGGQADLAARLIRCIGSPRQRFEEDHLRMLRAVRFAARFGFQIEADTLAAIRLEAPRIAAISPERIRMELELILAAPGRASGWLLLAETGLHNHLVPGLRFSEEQVDRVARILGELPTAAPHDATWIAWMTCLPPAGAADICRALRCSNVQIRAATFLLGWTATILGGKTLELADVKSLLASGWFEELAVLARAVARADGQPDELIEYLIERARGIPPDRVAPPPLATGDDLLALQVSPGPVYSLALDEVYRAQLNETIITKADAMRLLREVLVRQGRPANDSASRS